MNNYGLWNKNKKIEVQFSIITKDIKLNNLIFTTYTN